MKRRDCIKSLGLASAALVFSKRSFPAEKKAQPRSNILYIMSDDHTSQAIGAYGSRLASLNPTPAIDRLAREGIRLDNVFCTNSICTPSRASIITGQYSHVNGAYTLNDELPPEKQYLPLVLKRAGYQTAVIGKWHLKREPAEGFDYYNVLPGQGRYFKPLLKEKGKPWQNGDKGGIAHEGWCDDVITDISLEWLKRRDRTKPFFLLNHFKAPHDMFENAPRYDKLYEDVQIPEPDSLYERGNHGPKGHPLYGTSISKRNTRRNMGMHMKVDPSLPDKEYTHEAYQRYLRRYLRCVKGVDDNVVRLLQHLEKEGELDNTIIIYTSDQGLLLGEHDYMDKRWMYEECLRMPFLVRYPRWIKAGSSAGSIINNVDFAPTVLDIAGIATPDYMQGRSFLPILQGKGEPSDWPQHTYYRYWMHMAHHDNPAHYGIRTKDHKLIFFYGHPLDAKGAEQTPTEPYWELYDLRKDPYEMNNVHGDPAYAAVQKELKAELLRLKKQLGDTDEKYPQMMKIREKYWD